MSTQPLRNLDLPAVPAELKPLVPFLQRADELKAQEPIIAYWCSYHAAQLGITAKVKDAVSRNFLLSLLVVLETLKKDIGPNDAIDNDAASAAYVENFALRIFGMADNEDRSGKATRGTAKKFLAAVNFLELLKVFDNGEISELSDDKIRYAKWKAADIAKAFREGRKPTPGPANQLASEPEPQFPETPYPPEIFVDVSSPAADPPPPDGSRWPSEAHEFSHAGLNAGTPQGSGSWSTAATPGTFSNMHDEVENQSTVGRLDSRRAWVSDDLEGVEEGIHEPSTPGTGTSPSGFAATAPLVNESFPPGFVPISMDGGHSSPSAPPFEHSPTFAPSPVPIVPPLPPPPSVPIQRYQPPPPLRAHNPPPPPPPSQMEPDLTPQQIAKAQKLCKFAISALDYEDFTQARKNLREALGMLGG